MTMPLTNGGVINSFGSPLTENFDTLATSGTTNTWTDNSTIAALYATRAVSPPITVYRADVSNAGAIYSFGSGASTERAFGSISSGTPGTIHFGFKLTNNTGSNIGSLVITYNGEQWRDGGAAVPNAQTITFQYQVAGAGTITGANTPNTGWTTYSALSFTSPTFTNTGGGAGIDGNAVANRTAKSSTLVFPTPVASGQEIWIRWEDINDVGNDHGLAIDDISITAIAPPDISVGADVSQAEGNGPGTTTMSFTVTRSGDLSGTSTVNYSTTAGTATQGPCSTPGNDYESASGMLTFSPTDDTETITVTICGDTTPEPDETFTVNLASPTNATISDADATGTIQNDDGSVTYTWDPGSTQALLLCAAQANQWTCPGNWTPLRPTATIVSTVTSDILIFNGSVTPSPTILNVPTQTVAAIQFTNNINEAKFEATLGAATLTINGDTGSDFSIAAGSAVRLQGTNAITISLTAAGQEGVIAGNLIFQGAAHKLTGANAGEIRFNSASIFTTTTGFTGHPFGSGTDGSVIFDGGSNSFFGAGSDPFGGAGKNIVSFGLVPLSNQEFSAASAFDSNGRTYGNLTLTGGQTYGGSGNGLFTVFGDFVLGSTSTLTLSGTAGGDMVVNGNFTDNNSSLSAFQGNGRIVTFSGGSATQTIFKNTIIGEVFSHLTITKTGGSVQLLTSIAVNGQLQFGGSAGSAVDVLELNGRTVSIASTLGAVPDANSGFKGDVNGAGLFIGVNASPLGSSIHFISGGEFLSQLGVDRVSGVSIDTDLTIGHPTTTPNGILTLTNGIVDMGTRTLTLNPNATISRTNGYVSGNLKKNFGATGAFNFAVGTANGYSPVDVNVTAGTGDLTVKAVQGPQPNITGTNALQRYWTLNGTGITTDLTFNYLDPTDIPGSADENLFVIFKFDGSFTTPGGTVNTGANTATINGVTQFSDWTLAEAAAVQEGSLQFSAANYNDLETNAGSHPVTITVQRLGGDDGAVSVQYAVTDGSATTVDSDYAASPSSGTLNWADGDSTDKTFTVTVNGDTTVEPDETVTLTLSAPTGGLTIGGTNPATLTIQNDDVACTPPATPTASNDGPYCEGATIQLSTPTVAGATYAWTGPNGFTSSDQNPTRANATTADAGTYFVTITVSGCTSAAGSTTVVVNPTPATPTASNGGPYCEGATIQLSTSTVSGGTYSWTGPNGFTSSDQNPTRANATTADAGSYSVTVTVNGCTSAAGTTNVVVNTTPATPTASNDGPYCEGATINLSTPTVPGATYSWTGPNGFTSSDQNPTRANATTADAGDYFVTVTVNGCTSAAGSTNVVVSACTVQFAQANTDDTETNSGSHTVNVSVTRSGLSDGAVDVTYTVTDGSATTGDNDYSISPATGTLHWDAGDSTPKNIVVTVNGDAKFEPDETINLTLSSPIGATLGTPSTATLTILNDDTEPTISIDDVTAFEGDSGTTDFNFTVSLSNPSYLPITVTAQTANGTATTADADYNAVGPTIVTFTPGTTTQSFQAQVNGDTTAEVDEIFNVILSSPTDATIGDGTGVGTILNDDESVSAGQLIISEFRLSGPGANATEQANNEFIELYNSTDQDLLVTTTDGSAGWAVATSSGVEVFHIPNGTTIPARGHFLGTNTNGYSLNTYPAGVGTFATGDATWTTEVPDNTAIALFRTNNAANFNATNRLDSVGPNTETNTLYKEGAGYTPLLTPNLEHTFFRQICVFQAGCPTPGRPRDTNDNAADFIFADTLGTATSFGQRLGAPGPENLASPIKRDPAINLVFLDATVPDGSAPNRVRNSTPDIPNASTFGTMTIRRRVVNQTGSTVTRLRFRVIDMTTHPSGPFADLRLRSSSGETINGINDPNTCTATGTPSTPACTVNVTGLTLEQPPNQPAANGGGMNSTVTLPSGLAPGQSINVNFLLGVQKTGQFRFYLVIEALP